MPKLKLNPEPTFKAKVDIPIPGARPVPVEFIFRNRNREDFAAWAQSLTDEKPAETVVLEIAMGWDLDDAFNEENVKTLLSNYLGSFHPILTRYMDEITQAKAKN